LSNPTPGGHQHTNELAQESSPYLLQHAHNPVDWHAWGPRAFEKARAENKPIFLSVGYSTCYWCHVMERESFENESVAAEMNRLFVNIKVDREERADVDQLYMTAVQLITRRGGWPMSVWLTPDLRPFYGGTYFPAPQYVGYLRGLDDAYRNRSAEVEQSANQITGILRKLARPAPVDKPLIIDDRVIDSLIRRSIADYEPTHGGFGGAPKFPRETLLELLLTWLDATTPSPGTPGEGWGGGLMSRTSPHSIPLPDPPPAHRGREMEMKPPLRTGGDTRDVVTQRLRHALDAMADGGIRDQLGGGFHRYSTDAQWLVPHFEIMLYDNAMLGWVYAEAHRQFGQRRYADVARGIFDFVLREMTSPQGAFYTAFDAEVDAQEGLSYLWTVEEIRSLLGPDDAKLFNRVYGVDRGPNFADPHHGNGQADKNILFLPQPLEQAARDFNLTEEEVEARLSPMRQRLYEARLKRKQPLLDTKIITSWNALMIRALAHGGSILKEPRYVDAAATAASFLLDHHLHGDILLRTSRDGAGKYRGFLDDYAFLVQALLAVHTATRNDTWRHYAQNLSREMVRQFMDEKLGGFYFTSAEATDLIVRQITTQDSPLPSGNGIAAMALLALGQTESARATLVALAQPMVEQAEGSAALVQAAMQFVREQGRIEIDPNAQPAQADRPPSPHDQAVKVVSLKTEWLNAAELHVKLSVLEGFHINSNAPGGGDVPLIATHLAVDVPGATIEYPPGKPIAFAFTREPINVYEGEVILRVTFPHPPTPQSTIHLSLSYQGCDEHACLPTATLAREVEVPWLH
jgi:hypothetical protein